MYKLAIGFLLIAFVFQGCEKSKAKDMEIVTVDEMKNHLQYNSIPTSEGKSEKDFRKSHLVNAESILDAEMARERLAEVDKDSPIAIYSTSKNKINEAANILRDLGFQQIYILDGGIEKWSGENHITN